jgi:hypothetical protein
MRSGDFAREIRAAWDVLERLSLSRTVSTLASMGVNEDYRRVLLTPNSPYAMVYRAGLSLSQYNFLLSDYSYFQFGYQSSSAWRLAYWPNPWISGVAAAESSVAAWDAAQERGALSDEEVSELVASLTYMGAVPPIRFEYSIEQYRELVHPTAHFHIGLAPNNRWPCAVALGPKTFVMLICSLYYSERWQERSSLAAPVPPEECIDQTFSQAIANTLRVHEFSDAERRRLHFGRDIQAIDGDEPTRGGRHTAGGRSRRRA